MPASDQIELAHAPAFRVGPIKVEPALRQITAKRAETLEPRVMQVLVVLGVANGAIVSRDDLVRQCWEGRIVGDDSINRVIARLRKVAEDHGDGVLRIETIKKVGYRLIGPITLEAGPPEPVRQPSSQRRPTLAMLPLADRSGEAADRAFADDLVDDVISALSVGRGLRVMARSATDRYRRSATDVREIGTELDTDFITHGNIRSIADGVRISLQLIDARTGAMLWTQTYDLSRTTTADDQNRLVVGIAGGLCVQIQRIEIERALKKETDVTPFDLVQRSWANIPRLSPEGLARSIADARRAVAMAPDYALAAASLALALGLSYQQNGSREPEILAEALQHADRALQLNERHGTVLFQVALVKYYAQKWAEALLLAERSVELNPNMPEARHTLAGVLVRFERYDEALAQLDEADRMAPQGLYSSISLINRGRALFGARRFAEALDVANRLLMIMPSDRNGLRLRLVILAELGDIDRAREDMLELRRVAPEVTYDVFLGLIRNSQQADHVRVRDAELFEMLWNATRPEEQTDAAS